MSSAIRYDESTSKLELLTAGQSLKSIIHAYTDILECIRTSRDIRDVLIDPGQFFRSMHEIFSKCRVEKSSNGLNVLIHVITDSLDCMDGKQSNAYIKSLLSDVIGCLANREVRESAEALLDNIARRESAISSSLTMEIEHTLLNCRDSIVLEAVKAVSARLLGNSLSGFAPKQRRVPSVYLNLSREVNADLNAQSEHAVVTDVPVSSRGGVMKLAFLPHSITEQWLLSNGGDELRFVLEEITAVYNSLQPHVRVACRGDMPKMIKHVLVNCASGGPLVVVNGLKLLCAVAEHCVDAFVDDVYLLDGLFPKLQIYLNYTSEGVREIAFKLAVSLVAKLPFETVDSFILNTMEGKGGDSKNSESVLKLAGLGLLSLSKEHLTEESARFGTIKIRVGRIGKAAIKHLIVAVKTKVCEDEEDDLEASVDRGKADTTTRGRLLIVEKTGVQFCSEVAKDVIAAALLVLCPSDADPSTGIFPDLLPTNFIEKLFLLQGADGEVIENSLQAEISLRASGLSFPSLVTDTIVNSHLTHILATRLNKVTSSPIESPPPERNSIVSKCKDAPSVRIGAIEDDDNETVRLNQTWPGNFPTTPERLLSPQRLRLFDSPMPHIVESGSAEDGEVATSYAGPTLSYVPSWTEADTEQQAAAASLGRSLGSPWTSSESVAEVDRSKLSALKSSRRTPGSRRAHSAEVQSHQDFDMGNISPAPNTSDGQRMGNKVRKDPTDAGDDGGFSLLPTSTRGNYMTDGPVDKRVSPIKLSKRMGSKRWGGEDEIVKFETTEYQINLPVRNARDNSDDDDEVEGYSNTQPNSHAGGRAPVQNSPQQPNKEPSAKVPDNNIAVRATIPYLKRGEGKARREERMAAGNSLLATEVDAQSSAQRVREREWSVEGGLDFILADHNRAGAPKRNVVQHSPRVGGNSEQSTPQRRGAPTGSGNSNANSNSHVKIARTPLSMRTDREEAYQVEKSTPSKQRSSRPAAVRAREQEEEEAREGARIAPSALMPESLDYLDTSEIEPVQQPQRELTRVLKDLDTQGWPEIFHTLNSVRQLCLHHQSLILSTGKTTLHNMYQAVLRHADNLRSQVAKNAVLAIGDMYIGFGAKMDGEVVSTVFCLTKKCADSATTFLAATAESSLCRVIDHATSSRTLTGLLNCTDNRNPTLRARVAGFLQLLVSLRSNELRGCREIDVLKSKLEGMLNDNTPDARAFSRDIVRVLIDQNISSRAELEQRIPPDLVAKALSMPANGATSPIRKVVSPRRDRGKEKHRQRLQDQQRATFDFDGEGADGSLTLPSDDEGEDGEIQAIRHHFANSTFTAEDEDELENSSSGMLLGGGGGSSGGKKKKSRRAKKASIDPLESSNDMSGATPSRAKATAAKRIMDNSEDLLQLPDYYVALQSSLWTDRRDALTHICDLVCKHMIVLRDASKLNVIMDRLLEALEDGSVKVVLHALQCVSRMHSEAPIALSSMQNVVQPALLSVASSSNKQVSNSASHVLKDVLNAFPLQTVIQQLCQTALHDKDRLKVLAFRLLRESVGKCYSNSVNAAASLSIRKLIFPTICKVVLGSKQQGEIRVAAADALKEIQRGCPMGEKVSNWVEDRAQQEELQRILRS